MPFKMSMRKFIISKYPQAVFLYFSYPKFKLFTDPFLLHIAMRIVHSLTVFVLIF